MPEGEEGQESRVPTGAEAAGAAEASTPEKTEEQQKIEALVNQVFEVNAQLGGRVAAEVHFDDGRSTLFFARSWRGMQERPGDPSIVYGVDSIDGPVYASGELSKKLLHGSLILSFEQASSVTEDEVQNWAHPVRDENRLTTWQKAFEESRNAVIQDRKAMERIREEKNRILDHALSVVSKPIDLSTPPSIPTSA